MPRSPGVQFPGAISHIVTCGDGRRALFHDDGHYERLSQGLADEVHRSGWQVLAFYWMPSSANLLRRAKKRQANSAAYRRIKRAESLLASKIENQV